MDKYELKVCLDEIDRLIAERKFADAADIADTIDWTRVKGVHLLCRISDLYKINKRYKDSRDLMQMAYERNPSGRKIIYSLCELELKLNNYIHALQLYNAFINVAPRDSDRFLLQYKLYKKQDVNVYEQIAVLQEFLQHDFRERWAYELATLYMRAGEDQLCIRQCDEIVAYFGDGRFVIRALELKKSLTQLTPQQEERLEVLKSGGTIAPPQPVQEETGDAKEAAGEETGEPSEDGNDGTASEQDETPAGEDPADGKAEDEDAESADAAAVRNAVRNMETSANAAAGKKTENAAEDTGSLKSSKIVIDAHMVMPNAAAVKAGKSADNTVRAEREEKAERGFAEELDAEYDGNGNAEPPATPEEYTDTLLREVNMQETIARGMQEIGDYDSVLAQETNGQLAMVMEEEPVKDTQIEGQLDLAQIMSEWEKIRKDSEQQRLAEARRRVLERSEAAKRELYGDDYAGSASADTESADEHDAGQSSEKTATTRSWKKEDVESGLRDRK